MLTGHQRIAIRQRFPTAEVGERGGRPIVVVVVPGEGFAYALLVAGGWVGSPTAMDDGSQRLVETAAELQTILSC